MASHADWLTGQNQKPTGRNMTFTDDPAIKKLKYIHHSQHGGSQHDYLWSALPKSFEQRTLSSQDFSGNMHLLLVSVHPL